MENSFVAFFDILGFKNLVDKNSHEELLKIYNEVLYDSFKTFERIHNPIYNTITPSNEKESLDIKTFIISDSIILVQNTVTERGLLNLIAMSQILLSMTIAEGVPLRGAISYGPVTIIQNKYGTTIVGKGLTNAYTLESVQMWSGGIIDKTCFEVLPSTKEIPLIQRLLNATKNHLVIEYDVPLKNSLPSKQYVFDWTNYDLLRREYDIRDSFSWYNKDVDEKVRVMIDNTIAYYRFRKGLK